MIPAIKPNNIPYEAPNYYANLCNHDDDDDDITVVMSNKSGQMANDDAITTTAELSDDESTISDTFCANNITLQPSCWNNSPLSLPTRAQAWQHIAQNGLIDGLPHASLIHNTNDLSNVIHYALSDSGATAHFLMEGAPATNVQKATNPITITLPNGKTIQSTHTCNLDIPWLPNTVTEAHIVPGLSHSSLISTRKFCEAGCKVVFDINECRVYYKQQLVLSGGRDTKTGLWQLPVNPISKTSLQTTIANYDLHVRPQQLAHAAFNVYTLPYKQNQLKYMHQAFFSPTIPTLLHAIANNQLEGIPFMKTDLVRKYLTRSPATSKGHLKRPRAGIRSTRPKKAQQVPGNIPSNTESHPNAVRSMPETAPVVIPAETHEVSNVFCFAALADERNSTLYTDATGALPVQLLDGYQYYFIAYDYDPNYIFMIPIKDMKDESIIEGFEKVFAMVV